VTRGLRAVVADELRERFPAATVTGNDDPEALQVAWDGDPQRLAAMRTAGSVATLLDFNVVRPKALLGDENFRTIATCAAAVARSHEFHGLRLSAAGSSTPTMHRIAAEIAQAAHLPVEQENGDFLVRIRRSTAGWQLLLRLTPRPLSARPWRVVDYPVAANACIAAAMVRLARIRRGERILNVMCGSATIAIEAALAHPEAADIVAVDNNETALAAARTNAAAADVASRIEIIRGDATDLGNTLSNFDVAFADPPWSGDSRAGLQKLYERTLAELARAIRSGGRVIWLSHQVEMSRNLLHNSEAFSAAEPVVVGQGGLHPWLWVLRRR
jgi:tRNA (guanine6-N2)-methyltransferase